MTSVTGMESTQISPKELPKSFNDWPNFQGFNSTYQEHSPVELKVKGNIPAWAAGVLYRTGTGASEVETDSGKTFKVHHWFDGLAVVHRFQILPPDSEHDSVRVLYNSRSTCDGLIEKIRKTGDVGQVTFGRKYEPCTSFFKKVMSIFQPNQLGCSKPDERSMSVTLSTNFPGLSATGERQHHGHASGIQTLCNKTDANAFQMLDPETLEPVGLASQTTLHPDLKGPLSSAHARSDPITGDVFNYNLDLGPKPTYRIFRVSSTGKTSILASFHADAAYLHSFFLSKHYVVLCVWNSFFTASGASILWKKNIVDALADYDPSRPARWYVVDRRPPEEGGQGLVAIYESDHFYCFHTINAFEEASADGSTVDIVADLVTYPNLDTLKKLYLPNLISTSPATAEYAKASVNPVLKRFRLSSIPLTPVKTAKQAVLELTSEPLKCPELPTINPAYVLRRHRYVYGVVNTGKSTFFDSLVKYDTETGATLTWSEHGQTAGEAIFVPRRGTEAADNLDEDDGILLTVVLDGPAGRSYLLALDPKTMTETGRAELDGPVGFAFHGTHVPAAGKGFGGAEGRGLDF
ncbi:Carotenoid cleavage dioxygenase [Rasamsonia emersonii CBS 393.64]|uniref:Carotenoid cleavage dioxygenase n=1 Tax=Rasamsonia emersonii (strain ATCC 16479 / CBS 393.64 / IMI 116815) TaxID=1408163 RepID=A0A0F4YNI1_RASE3|nr:Carotenoid cleavage dioxygenase [Rasamsonia emersonii CBS 393.64]KKA19799.1 Carotenoid cleavage dioxygenase [Rasamsonia emersonii CBS 393.64]